MIQIEKLQIPALPTRKPRRLYIYTPRDYADTQDRYPVLYMFDGHNVFYDSHATFGKSWGMKAYLEKSRLPLIVVAIECNHEGDRRLYEYSPWPFRNSQYQFDGLARTTMEWMTGWLKPEIDRRCRTLPDREHTLLAGSSMGGLLALWGAVAYNQVYGKAAALSPSLWVAGPHMPQLIKTSPLEKPTRIYLDMGSAEAAAPSKSRILRQLFSAALELTKAGADVACRCVPGAVHNEAAWEKRVPVFLDYLLGE